MFRDYEDIVRIEELCQMLDIGKNKAYKLLNSGKIKAFKIGRIHKIPRESIIEYVKKMSNKL
jgi:excisionase family DNA binding protein